jgi:surface protein
MGPSLTSSAHLCGFHALSVLLTYAISVYAQVAAASCPGGEQFCKASNGVCDTWHSTSTGPLGRGVAGWRLTDLFVRMQVTIVCEDAEVGDTGVVDGMTYTKVDGAGLKALAEDESRWAELETSCTSGVTDMTELFSSASTFNQDIGAWDTSSVEFMDEMFDGATAFNQDIGEWNTSSATDMGWLFRDASTFNQDISAWDTSIAVNMDDMFSGATAFNQDLSSWNMSSAVYCHGFSDGATSWTEPRPNIAKCRENI